MTTAESHRERSARSPVKKSVQCGSELLRPRIPKLTPAIQAGTKYILGSIHVNVFKYVFFFHESKSVVILHKVNKLDLLCCTECFILLECKSVWSKYVRVAEAYTTQPNSKASSRVLYMYFSCMAG